MASQKGLLVGDAATRIKQTMMFDLPIVTKSEVQDLMKADVLGGGKARRPLRHISSGLELDDSPATEQSDLNDEKEEK